MHVVDGTGRDQSAELEWRDRSIPVSTRFDDPYFSLEDGLEETRHVFIGGNGLENRFSQDLHIAELGFGTGLNFVVTWAAWASQGARGQLSYTSFEAFPMPRDAQARALQSFPTLAPYATRFLDDDLGQVSLEIIKGDARQTLPEWSGKADAWYLDGFSPAKNPELWGPDLMAQVAAHTRPGGTFATYTAAGHVRRALADAGFDVARVPGYGRKRHMSVGRLA